MSAAIKKTAVALLAVLACSCGDEIAISGQTLGEIRLVRPGVTVVMEDQKESVFEDLRLMEGSKISVDDDGRAVVILDHGAHVVVDSATDLAVRGMEEIAFSGGRIWVDADEGEKVEVDLGDAGLLKFSGCSASLDWRDGKLDAYVASGELTYVLKSGSGTVREGEKLHLSGGEVEVSPSDLWDDWTGGLAEAGPRPMETPTGVGAIYARLPGMPGVERSPLVIRRQEVRVTIEGDLAVTETVQEFFNPASEVMEGIYRLRIPRDAVLQRFAVDRDGTLVDGMVVERKTARKTYEQQVYAGSPHDPALLEWIEPGKFKSRIYPIKPGEVRRIAYRYSQWLEPAGIDGKKRVYSFPMGNETIAPMIGEFSLSATLEDVGTAAVRAGLGARVHEGKVVFSASDFQPRSDFTLELIDVDSELEKNQVRVVTSEYAAPEPMPGTPRPRIKITKEKETYFFTHFSLRPEGSVIEPARALRVAVVLDLSAATDQELADLGTSVVDDLLRQLGPRDRVAVLAGDLKVDFMGGDEPALLEATEDLKERAVESLSRRTTGGATDIGEIITGAAAMVGDQPGGVVVYVGDAFPTVGEMDLEDLEGKIDRLPHAVRLYGVALGDESNLALLDGLCRGGGFASSVSNRIEAAELAYRILADASVPVFEDVRFEIDGGVERLYPRGGVTLRLNESMQILGRLTGEKDPESIKVTGTRDGKAFKVELVPLVEEIDDHGDLKLRWATKRLQGLMQEGAGQEAIVDLGNRYSLVTPFNSILVPSGAPEARDIPETSAGSAATAMPAEPMMEYEAEEDMGAATGHGPPRAASKKAMPASGSRTSMGVVKVTGGLDEEVVRRVIRKHMSALRYCYESQAAGTGLAGTVTVKFVIGSSGTVEMSALESSSLGNSTIEQCVVKAFRSWTFPAPQDGGMVVVTIPIAFSEGSPWGGGVLLSATGPTTTTTTTSLSFTHTTTTTTGGVPVGGLTAHKKACLIASLMPLEEKIALWQERLGDHAGAAGAMEVWRQAKRKCEVRTMQEKRALARVILAAVRGIPARCDLVRSLKSQPAVAGYIRRKILAQMTSPSQVQLVMSHCDGAVFIGPDELDKILAKAKSDEAKIVAVKELIALYPMDLDLELKLLDLLEDEGSEARLAEAKRLAGELRHAPYANEHIRTRVGEFYMRHDMEAEARRCFSEIVEFSPFVPSARRRLGDIYRNYGWHEDAYRQYETLQAMVPEDESVLVLMAEAAASAGRVDEALRLAERVSQSDAGSGSASGMARLFNLVRLAALRVKARAGGNEAMLKELMKRSRRAGVLRDTADLRVLVVWDHPDVRVKLFNQYEGSEVERASLVAPHFGCEAFSEKESSGEVLVQVLRDPSSVVKETAARLYVLWHEGTEQESLEVLDIVLKGEVKKGEKKQAAWTLSPGKITETKPVKIDRMAY
ncbi:MAG: TonB family protein [Deltaproteobacteria bacterium]|nr:TonB family protein [Deltaproteobacteria bacterium]